MRPMLLPVNSVNQRFPSGPAAMPKGSRPATESGNSVMAPEGLIRPTLLPMYSANQRFPSDPVVMPSG